MSEARRRTVVVDVGGVKVGGTHPVVVQSMTNTDTADAAATAAQVAELAAAGSELVRITVNHDEAAQAVPEIVQRLRDMSPLYNCRDRETCTVGCNTLQKL